MSESSTSESVCRVVVAAEGERVAEHASGHASLAALGLYLQRIDLLRPMREQVKIAQKKVRYSPWQKLEDALIGLLAGLHGVVEINTVLRTDAALQAAFGRSGCAEQSVIQDTLDACSADNVTQMQQALDQIFRDHSQTSRHAYDKQWQILDVDLTGMPCGPKAELATRGYLGRNARRRQGRQLGRVAASLYNEVVVDQVYAGTAQLATALPGLVEASEQTLALTEAQRQRTIIRVDAGGGTSTDVNTVLTRGYQFHGKDFQHMHVKKLVAAVCHWSDDPKVEGRQVAYIPQEPTEYVRPVTRIAVRRLQKNKQWRADVLISTLSPRDVLALTHRPLSQVDDPLAVAAAYIAFYDQRGGGVETTIKDDKQGLGLTTRQKKRFPAQQMLVCLGTLAHNIWVWAKRWLVPLAPQVQSFGLKRLVRDVGSILGRVEVDENHHVRRIVLNQAYRLAQPLVTAFRSLLDSDQVVIISGET
ncbi:MAG TPA: hypothetical protein PKI24_22415 [Nitrospira sp.]|nr:hypothetical protein [Nitrospira sp.]HNP42341.1 hypothetical protein [Nitrospira sp.]